MARLLQIPTLALLVAVLVGAIGCSATPQREVKTPGVGDTLAIEAVDWHNGQPIDLAQLRGKVTLVELWASWCTPCAAAMTHHSQLYQRLQTKGLRVLALSLDEDKEALVHFVGTREIPFAIAWDEGQKTAERLRPPQLPTSYVLDQEGKILGIYRGGDETALRAIRDQVETALEKP